MSEPITRQALPSQEYLKMIGIAHCVFASNNSFIIENILKFDNDNNYNWYDLIDGSSGDLLEPIKETITKNCGSKIVQVFQDLIAKRNRLMHSFQITDKDGKQRLATKNKKCEQYILTNDWLKDFIKKNQELSDLLYLARSKR